MKDPLSPDHGRIPIPVVLDYQLDKHWMEKMTSIKMMKLPLLEKMMIGSIEKRKKNWYLIFLTTLVLLLNLESVFKNQVEEQNRYQNWV